MEKEFSYPTTAELMLIIAKTEFRPFNKMDWAAFAGCESENPMIAESGNWTIVIDGPMVNVVDWEDEYGGRLYSLTEA